MLESLKKRSFLLVIIQQGIFFPDRVYRNTLLLNGKTAIYRWNCLMPYLEVAAGTTWNTGTYTQDTSNCEFYAIDFSILKT